MGVKHNSGISLRSGLTALALLAFLSGCEALREAVASSPDAAAAPSTSASGGETIERDVERPDVFNVTEKALWDGRPSLGGVWVAYPTNIDPERVVIRNGANGKSVIGALFRRERENPGPSIQLSSDAATALGIIAGTPTEISIIVLRRETIEIAPPPAPEVTPSEVTAPEGAGLTTSTMEAPARRAPSPVISTPQPEDGGESLAAIVEQTLAGIDPAATPAPAPVSRLRKPYIQIAAFAEEARANDLVTLLTNEGVQAEIRVENGGVPVIYRVISGPSPTRAARAARLRIIKGLGFVDAFYFR